MDERLYFWLGMRRHRQVLQTCFVFRRMYSAFYACVIKTNANYVIKNDKISVQFIAYKQQLTATGWLF